MKKTAILLAVLALASANTWADSVTLRGTSVGENCIQMGITDQDATNILLTVDLSRVVNDQVGTPLIKQLTGLNLSGTGYLLFDQRGMYGWYAWGTQPTGMMVKFGNYYYYFASLSLKSQQRDTGYKAYIRLDNATHRNNACVIELHELVQN